MDKVEVALPLTSKGESTSVEVYLFGATITRWTVRGRDILFLSSKAKLDGSKGIRGGIPVVFPQFGPGALPQHGFARTQPWTLVSKSFDETSCTATAVFSLRDSPATREIWPHAFLLMFVVSLGKETLTTTLTAKNTDASEPFSFTSLLHSYICVDDISATRIGGLAQKDYLDKTQQMKRCTEQGEFVQFSAETDRIFLGVEADAALTLAAGKDLDIEIKNHGFKNVVVWNPWIERSKSMADLDDEEYKRFVCVELGTVEADNPIVLPAGESWTAGQTFTLRLGSKI